MDTLTTPTGEYEMAYLKKIASSFVRGKGGKCWYQQEDIVNDLVVELLDGFTLHQAYIKLKKRYDKGIKTVNIDSVPASYLVDHTNDEENIRRVPKERHEDLEEEFTKRIASLDLADRTLMMLARVGYKDKDLAQALNLSNTHVRVKKHRLIKGLKNHGKTASTENSPIDTD